MHIRTSIRTTLTLGTYKVRYSGCAPMYVNVVFFAMDILNPHMTSLILD